MPDTPKPGARKFRLLSASAGPAVFLSFVLIAGAVGGGLGSSGLFASSSRTGTRSRTRTRTRTRTEGKNWMIKVTHVVFNHNWPTPNDGPGAKDALSIRLDFDHELQHGPRKFEAPGVEYGAGEWIVAPNNDGRASRNEPALYLGPNKEPSINIMARFEATADSDATLGVASADLGFPSPGDWFGVNRVTVDFFDGVTPPLHKFDVLKRESKPQGLVVTDFTGSQQFVSFSNSVPLADGVRKTAQVFGWRVYKVLFTDGTSINFGDKGLPINPSGIPTQAQIDAVVLTPEELKDKTTTPDQKKFDKSKGHPLYVVLDTPHGPWYDGDSADGKIRAYPWVKALDVVTLPAAAGGATDLAVGGGRLVKYIFNGGYRYHIGDKDHQGGGGTMSVNGGLTTGSGFIHMRLTEFIDKNGPWKDILACYDCAGSTNSYMGLIGCDSKVRFLKPFGYLNTVQILNGSPGGGPCNNPFFGETVPGNIFHYPTLPANTGDHNPDRSRFDNHAYNIFDGKVYDPNAGPETGTRSEADWRAAVIDLATIPTHADPSAVSKPVRVTIVK